MTECGVEPYLNAKVIANLKIPWYLKQSASLKENSFAYFSWKRFEVHVSNHFCAYVLTRNALCLSLIHI